MSYYNIVPKMLWSSLSNVKKDIYNYSIISCCHSIVFFLVIICTNPWPSDFRDSGFFVLLGFMIYLSIINLLNCIFLCDELEEKIDQNQPFGPLFQLCKTIRHIIFWMYGCQIQIKVINIAIKKINVSSEMQLNDLYINRICFLIWSIVCFWLDIIWLIKTCIYHQQINNIEDKTTDCKMCV